MNKISTFIDNLELIMGKNIPKLEEIKWHSVGYIESQSEIVGLSLYYCQIRSITEIMGLGDLKNLRGLNLYSNEISELSGVENLENLETLLLSDNKISEIKGLDTLNSLKVLNLRKNNISKISGLEKCRNLKILNLEQNYISIISNLDNLSDLRQLYLSFNRISHIEQLDSLKNLQEISLSNNNIDKIRGLASLKNLQELSLAYNKIKEIEGLSTLVNLKTIRLVGNELDHYKGLNFENADEVVKFCQVSKDWNPEIIYQKILDGIPLSKPEIIHPSNIIFFPNLNMGNNLQLQRYRKWEIKEFILKLENNESPNTYDLNHYGLFRSWRELERYFLKLKDKNPSVVDFLTNIAEKYSIEKDDGLRILL